MEITLSLEEAKEFAEESLNRYLVEKNITVHIDVPDPVQPSETWWLRYEDFQRIWKSAIQPTNDVPELRPAIIGLIKLYRALATEICQSDPGLFQAKIFVQSHTQNDQQMPSLPTNH